MNKELVIDRLKQCAKRYLTYENFIILDDNQDRYLICLDYSNELACVYLQFKLVEQSQDIFDDDSTPAIRTGLENAVSKYIFDNPDKLDDMQKTNFYVLAISVPATVLDDGIEGGKAFVRFHRGL